MDGGVFVTRNDEIRFGVIQEFLGGKISRQEAAATLSLSERMISKLAGRVKEHGLLGVVHGNRGKRPANRKDDFTKARIIRLKRDKYPDFNVTHALDKLIEEEKAEISYSTLHRWCASAGLLKFKQRRRKKGRALRERYAKEGYFVMMDGSPHLWFGEENSCLISTIDDATSDIPVAEFWPVESTLGCLSVLKQLVEKRGVPEVIYTDKAGIYGGSKRQEFSQFDRACKELGCKVIYANSPEAKGRIERSYRTLQDRLVAEMRLAGVSSYSEANAFLKEYISREWKGKFTHPAESLEIAYKQVPFGLNPHDVCCIKIPRDIRKNSTISFGNVVYVLRPKNGDPLIATRNAEIRIFPDNTWAVFCENRRVHTSVAPRNHQPDFRYLDKIRPGNADLSRPAPLQKTG